MTLVSRHSVTGSVFFFSSFVVDTCVMKKTMLEKAHNSIAKVYASHRNSRVHGGSVCSRFAMADGAKNE